MAEQRLRSHRQEDRTRVPGNYWDHLVEERLEQAFRGEQWILKRKDKKTDSRSNDDGTVFPILELVSQSRATILTVASFLDPIDLQNLAQTSRSLRAVLHDSLLKGNDDKNDVMFVRVQSILAYFHMVPLWLPQLFYRGVGSGGFVQFFTHVAMELQAAYGDDYEVHPLHRSLLAELILFEGCREWELMEWAPWEESPPEWVNDRPFESGTMFKKFLEEAIATTSVPTHVNGTSSYTLQLFLDTREGDHDEFDWYTVAEASHFRHFTHMCYQTRPLQFADYFFEERMIHGTGESDELEDQNPPVLAFLHTSENFDHMGFSKANSGNDCGMSDRYYCAISGRITDLLDPSRSKYDSMVLFFIHEAGHLTVNGESDRNKVLPHERLLRIAWLWSHDLLPPDFSIDWNRALETNTLNQYLDAQPDHAFFEDEDLMSVDDALSGMRALVFGGFSSRR